MADRSQRQSQYGRVEVLQLLAADVGADLAIRSNNGQTALIYAAAKNQSAAVRWLIDRNANVNMTDNDSSTAAMIAAMSCDIIYYLILFLPSFLFH